MLSTTNGVVFKVGEDDLGGHVVRVGSQLAVALLCSPREVRRYQPGNIVQQGCPVMSETPVMRAERLYHLHYGVYDFLSGARNPYPLLASDREDSTIKKTVPKTATKTPLCAGHRRKDRRPSVPDGKKDVDFNSDTREKPGISEEVEACAQSRAD